jgi:hypothetical protein
MVPSELITKEGDVVQVARAVTGKSSFFSALTRFFFPFDHLDVNQREQNLAAQQQRRYAPAC